LLYYNFFLLIHCKFIANHQIPILKSILIGLGLNPWSLTFKASKFWKLVPICFFNKLNVFVVFVNTCICVCLFVFVCLRAVAIFKQCLQFFIGQWCKHVACHCCKPKLRSIWGITSKKIQCILMQYWTYKCILAYHCV